ncbi:hypothetical protein AMECASPLE_013146 [Ameca splendens]|uniref:Uncharacterized protein n=1 Tax=Ameca splendens TaxID=208324 RepID=A0ABV1A8W8_9TELE
MQTCGQKEEVMTLRPVDVLCSSRVENTQEACETPGENEVLDMLIVKLVQNAQEGCLMQSKGNTHEYVLYANAARCSCCRRQRTCSPNLHPQSAIDKPVVSWASSPGQGAVLWQKSTVMVTLQDV